MDAVTKTPAIWMAHQLRKTATFSLLFVLAVYSVLEAQVRASFLVVRQAGSILYARQDVTSEIIARLEKNEKLIPLAEARGPETWYMVKTQGGTVGWVRASDVSPSDELNDSFKAEQVSTWSAVVGDGRAFDGTWSVQADASIDKAAGTWTLNDSTGKLVLRGTWSAEKFSTGWDGVWHASSENGQREYEGSWTAAFSRGQEGRLSELFEAAAHDTIRGIWSSADASGSWAIRASQ